MTGSAREAFGAACVAVGAAGAAACVAVAFLKAFADVMLSESRRIAAEGGLLACVLFGTWALVAALSAGKPPETLRVTYANGVVSAPGNAGTNSTVYIRWLIDPAFVPFPIPPDTPVYVDCRVRGSSDEWEGLETAGVPAGDLGWTGDLPYGRIATNYEYMVYSGYVPPIPVHTNGEWRATGMWYEGFEGSRAMPLHMRFMGDGRQVYPGSMEGGTP